MPDEAVETLLITHTPTYTHCKVPHVVCWILLTKVLFLHGYKPFGGQNIIRHLRRFHDHKSLTIFQQWKWRQGWKHKTHQEHCKKKKNYTSSLSAKCELRGKHCIISTLPMFTGGADIFSFFTGMDPGRGRSEFLLCSCPLFWQLFSCAILLQVSEKDKRLARTKLPANTRTLVNLERKRRKGKINVPL